MEKNKINFELNSIFFGDRKLVLSDFKEALKREFVFDFDNFLFYEIEKLNLSVYDVRQAIQFANRTSEGRKIILLSSFFWSDEVQNALLKVLEESPSNTFIFLFANSKKLILPTVLSRLQRYDFTDVNRFTKEAKEVLSLDQNSRLDSKIVKKIFSLKITDVNFQKNTENEKKDREAHVLFLNAIISETLKNNELRGNKDMLEKLVTISKMSDIEGGSPHLFIEWLLLTLPKLSDFN